MPEWQKVFELKRRILPLAAGPRGQWKVCSSTEMGAPGA
jgi:hypothetical protein